MRIRLNRERLLALIAKSNLSQNHWAMKLGLSRGHWSNIVNGKHPYPSARTRQLLVEGFRVPADELFVIEAGSNLSEASFQEAIAGRYLIDRELGQGGMGTVQLARDVKLGRVVAIKVISPEAVSGIGIRRFLTEVGYVARLQHPHIVPLYEAGDAAECPYYVMPYFRDGSLRDLLTQRHRLGLAEALPLLRGIGAALDHAHAHQVLHCDVKPGNVLLAGGHAYVADFGIARVIRSEALEWGRRGTVDSSAGTPAYVSPEQANGEPNLDGRSDLYSLACVAFELLAGRPPFEGRTTLEIVAQRFKAPVPNVRAYAPELPAAVAVVLERAMALDRAERHGSVREFVSELERSVRSRVPAVLTAARLEIARVMRKRGCIRTRRVGGTMDALGRDLRQAFRGLARRPGLAVTAALTLALGIGATTAIFSVVRDVMLRPLPYDAPERIVQIWNPWSNEPGVTRGRSPISDGDFEDVREAVGAFDAVAAFTPPFSGTVTATDAPERVVVTRASRSLFDVLGVRATLGRTFTADEDTPGGDDVVVVSHALWRRQLGGDGAVLGTVIRLDDVAHRIVGVMPPAFRMPAEFAVGQPTDMWKPLALDAGNADRGDHRLHAVARLRPGVPLAAANAELEALTARWIEQAFKISSLPPYYAVAIGDEVFGGVRQALWILLGAVGFVLLIACANVANLLLAHAEGRRTELAVRCALGAARSRIVSQLLTESLLLALLGGGLGLLLAYAGVEMLAALRPPGIPRIADIGIDAGTQLFTAFVAAVTALLFGSVPALHASRRDLVVELKADSRGQTSGAERRRFRTVLVTTQIALAVVLLIGAGLLIRTFGHLSNVALGFEPEGVLTFEVALPTAHYPDPEDRVRFHAQLADRVRLLPGVQAAGGARTLPLTTRLGGGSVEVEGAAPPRPGESWPNARWQVVTPGYFEAMRYALTAGRFLEPLDRADALPVVVVNETMAAMSWPGEPAIGKHVRNTNSEVPWFTVVGVVRDVRQSGLVDTPSPTIYFPHEQMPLTRSFTPAAMAFAIRTGATPLALAGAVREVVRSLDPNLPVSRLRTMDDIVTAALAASRFTMLALAIFAAVAVALAMIGIYGLLSYAVSQRRREMGIRAALGATGGEVLALVIRDGMRLTVVGLAVGIGTALVLTRLMTSVLYGVRPLDPTTFVVVPTVFVLVALVATYLPARRAVSVDPVEALRHQ